jgi:hypothetical protein
VIIFNLYFSSKIIVNHEANNKQPFVEHDHSKSDKPNQGDFSRLGFQSAAGPPVVSYSDRDRARQDESVSQSTMGKHQPKDVVAAERISHK